MNLTKIISTIKVWENKIFEKYPIRTILIICVIVILWQLSTVISSLSSIKGSSRHKIWRGEGSLSSIQSDVSSIKWDISSIESDVSSIKRDISSIESDVSSIESDVQSIKYR